MSKKIAGKKFSGGHSTVIEAAYELVRKLEADELVYKISLGIIRQGKMTSSLKTFKCREIPAGIEVVVRGNAYAQTIYIYIMDTSKNRERVMRIIDKLKSG